jgi:hypothetical protein
MVMDGHGGSSCCFVVKCNVKSEYGMVRPGVMSAMRSIRQGWQQYWFEPTGPAALGLCRIVFYATLALCFARFDASEWGHVDPVFWKPITLFRLFDLPLLSPHLLTVLQTIWKIALVTSCLGIWTRVSTWIAWGLGIYLLGLPCCFGKISHKHQTVVLVLGIMALSRCGDAWSLGARWKRTRPQSRQLEISACGGYTWPVRLTRAIFISVFFAAGLYKLRTSQLAWVTSDNLANVLIRAHYGMENVWNTLGLAEAKS